MKTPSATKKIKERIGTNVRETVIKLNCPKTVQRETVIVKASRLSLDTGVKYPDPDQIKSRTESPDPSEPMASSSDVPRHSNVQESDIHEKSYLEYMSEYHEYLTNKSANPSSVRIPDDFNDLNKVRLIQVCSERVSPDSPPDSPLYSDKKQWPHTGSNISKPPALFEIPQMNNPAAWVSSKTRKDTKPIKN